MRDIFRIATKALLAAALSVTPAIAETQDVASSFAESGDITIHYEVSGEGPLIVLVHGFPDYHASWDHLVPYLSDGYRVAAMDTRGYNLSGQPVGVEHYAMPKLIGDIAAVIQAEGAEKAIVIGHDWGAAISWQFAFFRPDLLDKLVILSVPHPVSFQREMATNPQQRENSQYARNFQKPGSEANLSAAALASFLPIGEEEKAEYVAAFERSSIAGMMNYYRANYPSGDSVSPDAAPAPAPPKINVPVLVLHGMQDTALLASGHNDTWEHISQDTTLMMLPEAGHWLHLEEPELVGKTIRSWLDIRKSDD